MKITELIGAKSHPAFKAAQTLGTNSKPGYYSYTEKDEVTSKLKELGWELIGKGYYSLVYSHPKYDYVLKVFTSNNRNWLRYIQHAMKDKSNPFFPKVVGKPTKLSDTAWAIRLEKLTPLAGEKDPIVKKYVDPKLELSDPSFWDILDPENEEFLLTYYPQLLKVLRIVDDISRSNGDDDLDVSNVMKRGDTFVITDPI
jgi:hypothetical protein